MEGFEESIEAGLKLTKRIYYGPNSAPKPVGIEQTPGKTHFLTSPMAYAMIVDPGIVDNPDIPSYQPHVHGRLNPPALIPLEMKEMELNLNCYLNSAFVEVHGSWRVHCVTRSKDCDIRLVIPMSEQGSILGVEVDVPGRSYSTQLIQDDDAHDMERTSMNEDGGFFKPHIFSLTVPQIAGGSILSFKLRWFQQLLYVDGQFTLSIPFTFPEYIVPPGKISSKRQKIQLNLNSGTGKEVICKAVSHPLKEIRHKLDKVAFIYETDHHPWSSCDFYFSYAITSSNIFGGLLSQSPAVSDSDQREMFCLFLFPSNTQNTQVFRKDVVFLIDVSESMRGKPLEDAKQALSVAISNLTPADSFNIIAFNGETFSFSSSLMSATPETVENATHWMRKSCVAGGETNILQPLNEAMKILPNTDTSIPCIFLITDGAVEDERDILNIVKSHVANRGLTSPRISTFGIGSYCNHYFLRMLALTGRGYYDAAYDADSIDFRIERLLKAASSTLLRNVSINSHLDGIEMYPFPIPDLLLGSPLIVSGRYQGNLPDFLKVAGSLPDRTDFVIDLNMQKAKDIPLDKILAKQQIDLLTAQAWCSKNKQVEDQVKNLSLHTGFPSEYTHMVLIQTDAEKHTGAQEGKKIDLQKHMSSKESKISVLHGLSVGFGSVAATVSNISPTEFQKDILLESGNGSGMGLNCCNISVFGDCWCACCGSRECSRLSNDCTIAFAQLCTALSCFGCLDCCINVCCDDCD